jgi:hypothetical protein
MQKTALSPFFPEEDFSEYFGIESVQAYTDSDVLMVDIWCKKTEEDGEEFTECVTMQLPIKALIAQKLREMAYELDPQPGD